MPEVDWLLVGLIVAGFYFVIVTLWLIACLRDTHCPRCYRPVFKCSCKEDFGD